MKQNFIELITVPFNAGESKLFAISGQYFELIDATNPIDVLLSDVNGAQRGVMRSAEASFNLKDTDFATVQLYSATAQTIRFAYGTGEAGTRRAAGAVSIVGTVPVNVSSSVPLSLATSTLDGLRIPRGATGNWSSTVSMAANTPLTVFAPGSNVNGAILLTAESSDQNAAILNQCFIAKSSPPTNVQDGEVILQSRILVATGSAVIAAAQLQQAQFIPAGLGLYFISSLVGTANYMRSARFALL